MATKKKPLTKSVTSANSKVKSKKQTKSTVKVVKKTKSPGAHKLSITPVRYAIGLAVVLLLAISLVFVRDTGAEPEVYLQADKTSIQAGETFRIKIYVDSDGNPVNAVQAVVKYAEDQLVLKSVNADSSSFSITAEETLQAGSVKLVRGTVEPLTDQGLVAELEFQAKKTGSIPVEFDTEQTLLLSSETNQSIVSDGKISSLTVKVN